MLAVNLELEYDVEADKRIIEYRL